MFKKNDIIPLTIESITNEGSGIGHTDGIAVFVPMTAAGDELRVRIVKVQKSYCYGIIEEVITPSPDRVPVDCPSYKRCGGCSLRHITYEAELREKVRFSTFSAGMPAEERAAALATSTVVFPEPLGPTIIANSPF